MVGIAHPTSICSARWKNTNLIPIPSGTKSTDDAAKLIELLPKPSNAQCPYVQPQEGHSTQEFKRPMHGKVSPRYTTNRRGSPAVRRLSIKSNVAGE